MEELDTIDIYLKKDDRIIGLHAIGYAGPYEIKVIEIDGSYKIENLNFNALEMWGNEYNEDYTIKGRGSFRLFGYDLDKEAKEFEEEGWVRFERLEIT